MNPGEKPYKVEVGDRIYFRASRKPYAWFNPKDMRFRTTHVAGALKVTEISKYEFRKILDLSQWKTPEDRTLGLSNNWVYKTDYAALKFTKSLELV